MWEGACAVPLFLNNQRFWDIGQKELAKTAAIIKISMVAAVLFCLK